MKSSGRGFSARARRSSGVISRLIGTPQIACACASSAARSDRAAAAPFVQIGSCGGSGSFGRMDVERIAVGSAPAHLQRAEHVGRAAGKRRRGRAPSRRPGRRSVPPRARPRRHGRGRPSSRRSSRRCPASGTRRTGCSPDSGGSRAGCAAAPGSSRRCAAAPPCRAPSPAFHHRARRSSRNAARGNARRRRLPARLP